MGKLQGQKRDAFEFGLDPAVAPVPAMAAVDAAAEAQFEVVAVEVGDAVGDGDRAEPDAVTEVGGEPIGQMGGELLGG